MFGNFADIIGFGAPELVVLLVILLLLFGGKKLPQLAQSIGSSMKELRKGMSDDETNKNSAKETSSSDN